MLGLLRLLIRTPLPESVSGMASPERARALLAPTQRVLAARDIEANAHNPKPDGSSSDRGRFAIPLAMQHNRNRRPTRRSPSFPVIRPSRGKTTHAIRQAGQAMFGEREGPLLKSPYWRCLQRFKSDPLSRRKSDPARVILCNLPFSAASGGARYLFWLPSIIGMVAVTLSELWPVVLRQAPAPLVAACRDTCW